MVLDLQLAGHVAPWHFPHALNVRGWLSRQPWTSEGGCLALYAGGQRSLSFLRVALREAVFAADYGVGLARYMEITVSSEGTLLDALSVAVGLAPAPLEGDTFRSLAAHLAHLRGLVAVLTPQPGRQGLVPDALDLVDRMKKHPAQIALTLLVLGTPETPSGTADFLDFRFGAPGLDGLCARQPDSLLWQAYLHSRFAWEAGGDLELLLAWSEEPVIQECMAEISDARLEERLNVLGDKLVSEVADGQVSLLLDWVGRHCIPGLEQRKSDRPPQGLRRFFRTHRSGLFLRAPSFARGMLLKHATGMTAAMKAWLRGHLVCRPLASHLLARCLELETQLRGRAWSHLCALPVTFASLDARRGLAEPLPFDVIPQGHPAPLCEDADVWEFASLGEILKVLGANRSVFSNCCAVGEPLRVLRNSLAHGHYVSWAHLDVMGELEQEAAMW